MNEEFISGWTRAKNAAWDGLPKFLVATVVVIAVSSSSLWFSYWSMQHRLESVISEQQPPRFCERIGSCTTRTAGARDNDFQTNIALSRVQQTLNEREIRINRLEDKVYEMSTRPSARPDPFTGTQGRELDQRLKALEQNTP